MFKALLWDHDGVLVDTEGLYFQATREAFAQAGVSLTEDLYRRHFLVGGEGAWHLVAEHGVSDEAIAALKVGRSARYAALLGEGDRVIPGVREVLATLAPHYRMAIVTTSRRAHFEVIHQASGIPALFSFVLAREDYVESKPAPEPYLTAVARIGLPPAECLVIEDSRRGMLAAKAAGLTCWVVPSALTRTSSFAEADRRFESLAELAEALAPRP